MHQVDKKTRGKRLKEHLPGSMTKSSSSSLDVKLERRRLVAMATRLQIIVCTARKASCGDVDVHDARRCTQSCTRRQVCLSLHHHTHALSQAETVHLDNIGWQERTMKALMVVAQTTQPIHGDNLIRRCGLKPPSPSHYRI